MRKISVITINRNDWENTRECLESLRKVRYSNVQVIVIDNGSKDGSDRKIREEYPDVLILKNPMNTGFAPACNQGIRRAFESGSEFVFLLNNDAVILENTLSVLVDTYERMSGDPILGCKVLFYSDPTKIQSFGGGLNTKEGDFEAVLLRCGEPDEGGTQGTIDCDFIPGCALFASRDRLERIGLFDEKLFFVWEDADLGIRNRREGGHNCIVTEAKILHKGDGYTGHKPHPLRFYVNARNKLYVASKHSDYLRVKPSAVEKKIWEEHRQILASGYWLRRTAARAIACAIEDFHAGRFGKFPGWMDRRQEAFWEYRIRNFRNMLSQKLRRILG